MCFYVSLLDLCNHGLLYVHVDKGQVVFGVLVEQVDKFFSYNTNIKHHVYNSSKETNDVTTQLFSQDYQVKTINQTKSNQINNLFQENNNIYKFYFTKHRKYVYTYTF